MSFEMCFSPLAQGHGHGYDSAIFATVGNALNKGRVLYTEIVDNKGPLIYFIDALQLIMILEFLLLNLFFYLLELYFYIKRLKL